MENVRWVSFHSGYDFGYLLKILTCSKLPQVNQFDFKDLLLRGGGGGSFDTFA